MVPADARNSKMVRLIPKNCKDARGIFIAQYFGNAQGPEISRIGITNSFQMITI
jgi:hypothetical protein